MNHSEKVKAIQSIRPNAEFTLQGLELTWLDKTQTQPTDAEIEEGWISYQTAQQAEEEAKAQAKASAEAKLAALGLTADDLKALGL
jgi:hypothetical protein